jgi:hypothetical protein
MPRVETSTPPNTPAPIGPYSHIARVERFITIGGTAGVDPATGRLAGPDVGSQARQILDSFAVKTDERLRGDERGLRREDGRPSPGAHGHRRP